jgi:hypothetical protein
MRNFRRSMLLQASSLAALLALTGAASAQTPVMFHPGPSGQIEFVMPSQNIGCTYTPAGGTPTYKPFDGGPELSCDRIAASYVRVVLTRTSLRRFDNPGDQGCCSAENVFPYGAKWSAGPFICEASQAGLSCSRADGRGFAISRASVELR